MLLSDLMNVWEANSLTTRTIEHLTMFSIAIVIASIIGVSLGIYLYSRPGIAHPVLNFLNVVETIPDIPLLVLLLPIFGLGEEPTIVASILYSLLPITRNTYTGLKEVDQQYVDIAHAMGLSQRDILFRVRIPLSLPMIAGGLRIALVFTMGVVTLGGLIAAGGLGAALIAGIQLYEVGTILVAGIWTGLLAVILDGFAGSIEKKLQRRYGTW
ncbi:osmoprotectant transport system permease protein [Methanococcoides vulcani]|uniref:Osmoprotectant transport system permease protein n=1 Tax=Methanococcoides vulcani TaxID=1353158 RepID=A0A1H9ZWD4_9EURY|nr:ABC transporter permease [Methanococcoides vulcani]SES86049.1 osmoprotectant transport system permease protein [Methanococcoides vulcani]